MIEFGAQVPLHELEPPPQQGKRTLGRDGLNAWSRCSLDSAEPDKDQAPRWQRFPR
jgi:hypothetical protein